jgi:hypothetical protein
MSDALAAHRDGRLQDARSCYESILKTDKKSDCVRPYAEVLRELGETDKAISALRRAVKSGIDPYVSDQPESHSGLYPVNTCVASTLAMMLAGRGDIREAKAIAIETLAASPDDVFANLVLILALYQENRIDQAVRHYDAAPASAKRNFHICEVLSKALIRGGRIEEGLKIRNAGRKIPVFSLQKILQHSVSKVTFESMMRHVGAPPHPSVKALDIKADNRELPVYLSIRNVSVLSGEWHILTDGGTVFCDLNHGTPTGDPT